MKALEAGYGELTPKKVSGIANMQQYMKNIDAITNSSGEQATINTRLATAFVMGNPDKVFEPIKPEMHQL